MADTNFIGFQSMPFDDVDHYLETPTDRRIFAVAHAMIEKKYSVDKIHDMTKIDKWFLYKLENIVRLADKLSGKRIGAVQPEIVLKSKQNGFSDLQIAQFLDCTEEEVRDFRKANNITPYVKRIDTLAAEFPATTNYLYTTYNATSHDVSFNDRGFIVLGSGVYRIGSSVEFDWCGVSCIRTLRHLGFKTIMINYNPETVSTDFDECDRLYFEEVNFERTMDIYELEQASGCVVSMGGQLPQNIALKLWKSGVNVLGTSPEMVDR
jgi:carbamoyl-phosphate synthase large subunit